MTYILIIILTHSVLYKKRFIMIELILRVSGQLE